MTLPLPNEDPTAKGDRVAALMRAYHKAHKPTWWQGGYDCAGADALMLSLMQIVLWEYRHDWPVAVKEGKPAMAWWRQRVDNYHHYPRLIEVKAEIDKLRDLINEKMEILMATMADLQASVARNTDAEDSVIALLRGISQQLKDAKGDPAALDKVIADLDANTAKLGAAVVENTDSA